MGAVFGFPAFDTDAMILGMNSFAQWNRRFIRCLEAHPCAPASTARMVGFYSLFTSHAAGEVPHQSQVPRVFAWQTDAEDGDVYRDVTPDHVGGVSLGF